MIKSTKRIEWERRINDWKASGLSKSKWCSENGYKVHQMYYWIEKIDGVDSQLKIKAPHENFIPVKVTHEPDEPIGSVFIHIDQMSVEVQPGADIDLLSKVLYVLQS